MKAYYDRRAREYDDWWLGTGLFEGRDRPGWEDERVGLENALESLEPANALDIACGTGFLTRELRGDLTCVDQSDEMLAIAEARLPYATFVRADVPPLPFGDNSFDRVFTSHFYGHLEEPVRSLFLTEARRVAKELVVVDSALRDDVQPEERQVRELKDGSRWEVYKRYFEPDELAAELGGGDTLFAGRWFVAVRA